MANTPQRDPWADEVDRQEMQERAARISLSGISSQQQPARMAGGGGETFSSQSGVQRPITGAGQSSAISFGGGFAQGAGTTAISSFGGTGAGAPCGSSLSTTKTDPIVQRGPALGLGGFGRGLPLTNMNTPAPPPFIPSGLKEKNSKNDNSGVWDEDFRPDDKADTALLQKMIHRKLEECKSDVVDVQFSQSNPESPLHSVRTFEELNLPEYLLNGVYEMGFNKPSKIQETALPILMCAPPQNMIAQSQSGTGKTAAFVLTMLYRVDKHLQRPQCLCLCPTYELAQQIGGVVTKMAKFEPDIKVRLAVKGQRVYRGQAICEQIVIGTPGTMLDWVQKFKAIEPQYVKVFCLDEADVMISQQGHQDQSMRIYNEIKRGANECQYLLFSATFNEQVMNFANDIVHDPAIITLRREEQSLDNIKQFFVSCRDREDKFRKIKDLYCGLTIGSSIIFCYTKVAASWLADKMKELGQEAALLSSDLMIEERANVINDFKESRYKVLITTNVCARGIDVQQVTMVVNYDLPVMFGDRGQPDYETYLHRIGRTGRFGKAGIAVNFVDGQQSKDILAKIENHFGRKIPALDTEDIDALEAIEKGV